MTHYSLPAPLATDTSRAQPAPFEASPAQPATSPLLPSAGNPFQAAHRQKREKFGPYAADEHRVLHPYVPVPGQRSPTLYYSQTPEDGNLAPAPKTKTGAEGARPADTEIGYVDGPWDAFVRGVSDGLNNPFGWSAGTLVAAFGASPEQIALAESIGDSPLGEGLAQIAGVAGASPELITKLRELGKAIEWMVPAYGTTRSIAKVLAGGVGPDVELGVEASDAITGLQRELGTLFTKGSTSGASPGTTGKADIAKPTAPKNLSKLLVRRPGPDGQVNIGVLASPINPPRLPEIGQPSVSRPAVVGLQELFGMTRQESTDLLSWFSFAPDKRVELEARLIDSLRTGRPVEQAILDFWEGEGAFPLAVRQGGAAGRPVPAPVNADAWKHWGVPADLVRARPLPGTLPIHWVTSPREYPAVRIDDHFYEILPPDQMLKMVFLKNPAPRLHSLPFYDLRAQIRTDIQQQPKPFILGPDNNWQARSPLFNRQIGDSIAVAFPTLTPISRRDVAVRLFQLADPGEHPISSRRLVTTKKTLNAWQSKVAAPLDALADPLVMLSRPHAVEIKHLRPSVNPELGYERLDFALTDQQIARINKPGPLSPRVMRLEIAKEVLTSNGYQPLQGDNFNSPAFPWLLLFKRPGSDHVYVLRTSRSGETVKMLLPFSANAGYGLSAASAAQLKLAFERDKVVSLIAGLHSLPAVEGGRQPLSLYLVKSMH